MEQAQSHLALREDGFVLRYLSMIDNDVAALELGMRAKDFIVHLLARYTEGE